MKNKLTKSAATVLDSKPGLWYQHAVRLFDVATVLLVCTLACGVACGPRPAPEPTPASSGPETTGSATTVNPARIDRVREDLPPGYEVVAIDPRATPVSLWGFGPDWTADPAECATAAAPGTEPGRGWSASGPGGIVYAAVAKVKAEAGVPEPGPDAPCEQWRVSGGHSTGTVTRAAAPVVEGAVTAGMSTAVTTVVEGGTETRSHADTFTADLHSEDADYHLFITVVTDPGSPNPALDPAFTSDLLVKSVSALRG
ncbi:DUF5642 family protein [Mycobacterium sp. NPDC050441]|uniref:DUF5642 family protein n=1 Tax=Mycobacterium sp. NPDC050441 TaxID=3155403 RepID=UPI0033DA2081